VVVGLYLPVRSTQPALSMSIVHATTRMPNTKVNSDDSSDSEDSPKAVVHTVIRTGMNHSGDEAPGFEGLE